VRFGGVHGQPRLTHDVLAGVERGTGHLAMHIRPGADDNGVGITGGDQLPPILVDLGDFKLVGHPLRGFAATIAHADDFDPLNRLQPRNVPHAGVIARADNADSNWC
jgi:hypothetical protein